MATALRDAIRTVLPRDARRRWPRVMTVVLCLAGLSHGAAAQGITAPELRAAFLANFSKFTGWPDDALPPGRALTFCIVDDQAVAVALEGILAGSAGPSSPAVSVRLVKLDASIRACHLLYVGKLNPKQSAQMRDTLQGASVFTVGDGEGFAASGGVGQFILKGGRMRFAINVAAAQRARLTLSSKLLSLATLVEDAE